MPTVCSVKYGEIMCLATCLQNNAKICKKNNFRIHVGFPYYLKFYDSFINTVTLINNIYDNKIGHKSQYNRLPYAPYLARFEVCKRYMYYYIDFIHIAIIY